MEMRTPDAIVSDWYRGEVGGIALFALLEARAGVAEAAKWRALGRVESLMSLRLASVLASRGIATPDTSDLGLRATQRCEPLRTLGWTQQMHWLHRIAEAALVRMRGDAASLPADLVPIGALVVAHEVALVNFAACEMEPRGVADALRGIETFITDAESSQQGSH